jgi:hypothetical protein
LPTFRHCSRPSSRICRIACLRSGSPRISRRFARLLGGHSGSLGRYSGEFAASSSKLRRLPEFFELLPHSLGDAAKPLGAIPIHLARHALQLRYYPAFLGPGSVVASVYAGRFRVDPG